MTTQQPAPTLPPKPISPAKLGNDLAQPTVNMLQDVGLLPDNGDEQKGRMSALQGPPASVALIKAGLTAGAKWWSAGGSVTVLGIWGAVKIFWGTNADIHRELIWAAALTSSVILFGIGWLLTSDIRSRAAVQVATLTARASVIDDLLQMSGEESMRKEAAAASKPKASNGTVIPFPAGVNAKYAKQQNGPVGTWHAIATRSNIGADGTAHDQYYLVSGHDHLWVSADEVSIDS